MLARTLPLLALLLLGCGSQLGPGVLRVSADEPTALAAVEQYVSSMGWSVDVDDAANQRVVAHVDTRDANTLQRDTWTFRVTRGFVSVHRRMALGDTNGTSFVTSDDVCGSYTYSTEDEHLARIGALIASAKPSQRVARR